MKKKESMYPKGSDGLCRKKGCREIAEWELSGQLCPKHFEKEVIKYDEITSLRVPHIIRTDEGTLYVRCLICNIQWRPKSFDLEKTDPDYGRIPHKCQNKKCKKTILTRDGRLPRFDRVKGLPRVIKGEIP